MIAAVLRSIWGGIRAVVFKVGEMAERFLQTRLLLWVGRNLVAVMCVLIFALMVVIFFGIGGVVDRQHRSALEACERGNETRPVEVENLRTDRRVLQHDVVKLEGEVALLVEAPSSVPGRRYLAIDRGDLKAKRKAIAIKSRTIQTKIHSIEAIRSEDDPLVADCGKAYP